MSSASLRERHCGDSLRPVTEAAPAIRSRVAVALAVASIALLATVLLDSLRLVDRPFPGFLVWDNGALVAFHSPGWTGPAAALPLNGGVVVAIDGQAFSGGRALLDRAAQRPPPDAIRYAVETADGVRDYDVATMRLTATDWALSFGNYLVAAAAFLAIGVIALWLRPDLRAARALALVTTAMGALLALSVDYLSGYRFVPVTRFVEALAPAALGYFALVFPVERLRPRARRVAVAALALALFAAGCVSSVLFYTRPRTADDISLGFYVAMAAIGLAMLVSFGEALVRARDPVRRMQAAVVLSGSLVAVLVPAIGVLAFTLVGWSFSWTWIGAFFLFFPASVLYAIVRHDLLGAERFVRLTLGYAIATAAVVLGYAVTVFVLEQLVHPGAAGNPGVTFALLIAIAVSFDPLRRRVQVGIDRAFFRSRLDMAQVMEEASSELATRTDAAAIAALVAQRIEAALALDWAELRLGDAPSQRATPACEEPVRFRGERLGALACGPKLSGAPFSTAERELVRGLAAQAALALQNAKALDALREAQEALLRSARLAAVGEFAGSVAHGIRNPLAGIRAAAQLAHRQAADGPLAEPLLAVLNEADRLEQRIRSLLDFSRPHEPRLERVDLCELARVVVATLEPHARANGVAVAVAVPDVAIASDCDPALLEEALLELAGNALRMMAAQGGGSLDVALRRDGRRAVVEIADTGPGIPEGVRDRVFDLFFTTRPEGTGIGLATVKKIIESQGGSVSVARSGPSGTSFRIELPAL